MLDELPVSTLTGPTASIDAELFPNLARLAADATWYRNATTVADSTSEAVPAQLTGELPEPGDLPTSTHHPRSLFTLFRRSHGSPSSSRSPTSAPPACARSRGRRCARG